MPGRTAPVLVFTYEVKGSDRDEDGISIEANRLRLNGGSIADTDADGNAAALEHPALPAQSGHKVDGSQEASAEVRQQTPRPTVTGVTVVSDPGEDDTYVLNDVIRIRVTFSETVSVSGNPRLKIDMDPADWGEKWAAYEGGSGTNSLTFTHTVVEPNLSTQGIAVLADSLELNGGGIASVSASVSADLSPRRTGPRPRPQGGTGSADGT